MKRSIGLIGFTFIGVSGIIGSGWLFSSLMTSQLAGPASVVSWLIGAAAMLILALCFAEVSALLPVAGSIIRIPQLTHGCLTAALLGWTAWLGYNLAAPIETVAMLQYLAFEYPWLYVDQGTMTGLSIKGKGIALVLLLIFVVINGVGVRFFIRANSLLTWFKLAIPLILAAGLLLCHFEPDNFTGHGGFAPTGYRGIFAAVSSGGIVFAFLGFRHALDMAGEVKRPQRTIPLALILIILICTLVYGLLQFAFIGALSPTNLKNGWQGLHFGHHLGPVAGVVAALGMGWASALLYAGATVGPLGASLVATGSNARICVALSAIRLLPHAAGRLSGRGVPLNGLMLNLVIGVAVVVLMPFQEAVALNSAAITLSLLAGPLGLYCLRLEMPEMERRFCLPLAPVFAVAGFTVVTLIIYWSGWETVRRLGLALLLGGIVLGWRILTGGIPGRSLDHTRATWLIPYGIGLGAVSYYGEFGGGQDVIPFGLDLLLCVLLSAMVFLHAVSCRLERRRMSRFLVSVVKDEEVCSRECTDRSYN